MCIKTISCPKNIDLGIIKCIVDIIPSIRNPYCEIRPLSGYLKNGMFVENVICWHRENMIIDTNNNNFIDLTKFQMVFEHKNRLSPYFANIIYSSNEKKMDSHIFSLTFKDGCEIFYITGGNVDILDMPVNRNSKDVVDVKLNNLSDDKNVSVYHELKCYNTIFWSSNR